MAIKNKLILGYILVCFFALFYGCISPSYHESLKKVNFSCNEIYVDTIGIDASILFKVLVSNKSNSNFYFFSNYSSLYRDSVYSNFYLLDVDHNMNYQLLSILTDKPLNPLFSEKSYRLPLLMNREATWKKLRNEEADKLSSHKERSKEQLTIDIIKHSQLLLINDKRDFKHYHIDLKYFIRDTVYINYTDSIYLYFSIPTPEEFMNDSLFKERHTARPFLIHKNKEKDQ